MGKSQSMCQELVKKKPAQNMNILNYQALLLYGPGNFGVCVPLLSSWVPFELWCVNVWAFGSSLNSINSFLPVFLRVDRVHFAKHLVSKQVISLCCPFLPNNRAFTGLDQNPVWVAGFFVNFILNSGFLHTSVFLSVVFTSVRKTNNTLKQTGLFFHLGLKGEMMTDKSSVTFPRN